MQRRSQTQHGRTQRVSRDHKKTDNRQRSHGTARRHETEHRPAAAVHQEKLPTLPNDKKLRVIPMGGLGEIGKNMTLLEYDGEILIIDVGLRFPEEDMPGVDFIIPNVAYLEDKKDKIVGVLLTHGHYDHIGAIPYLNEKLGNPVYYTAPLTKGIVLRRQIDFPNQPKLKIIEVKADDKITLGHFRVEFIHINHNIPDDMSLFITTPVGNIFFTSDFKFDPTPVYDKPADIERFREIGKKGIMLLMADSTGAENAGASISEKTIQTNLEEIFKVSKGKIISATFASLITRMQQVITLSEKYGRKVVIEGYSMKTNFALSKELGYIKIQKHTLIGANQIHEYPPSKVTVLCTGAQGEGNAVLMRIANKEHRSIEIEKGDSVIFSSSVIPGNERTVQGLKDTLYKQGAVVFHYKMMDIHAGGHAQREDLKKMISLIKPKFFMPVHGYYSMMYNHGYLAEEEGIKKDHIILADNGQIIAMTGHKFEIEKKTVPSNYIMVDGLGIGDVGVVVLRDRQVMAKDGMFVIIAVVDGKTGKVQGSPDIISRGFVYLRESQELLHETRRRVRIIVERATLAGGALNWAYLKDQIRDKVGEYLYQKTERRPMVLPVIIEI
jgi:ribonuclease J